MAAVAHRVEHESNDRYRAIFDLANDAIFLHDAATGAILDVNRKATEMYGYTRDETVRLRVADLSASEPPYTQAHALERLRAAAAGSPQLFEWMARDRAGRVFWVEVNLKLVEIDRRNQLLAVVRDITDRKRTERQIRESHESHRTLNALLRLSLEDTSLDELLMRALGLVLHNSWPVTAGVGAIYLNDADGRLVLKTHIGLDERSASDAVDRWSTPITAGATDLGLLRVYLEPSHPLERAEREFLEAFASTLAGIIVRKHAEQDLNRADDQIREQAALVRLGQMAAVVAHEVRNPLAGIRGTIEVIGGRLPRDSRDAAVVSEVLTRLDALDELMTDLLLFARPPRAHFVPVDVVALAKETSDLIARDSNARSIRFIVEGTSPAIVADPKFLRSVFLNVLINAAHAVQDAGTVCTSIAATAHGCVVAMSDTGPGIPPDIRDRIFVPFFTTKARGTGLGLPTAKRLVDAHHGRISVSCPQQGGTTVMIELPRDASAFVQA